MRIRSLSAAVAIVVALTGGVVLAAPARAYPSMPQGVQGPFTVTKVVDGETIWVDNNGKSEKMRMIGIDTPETVDPRKPMQCFGLEASAQAKTILGGQSVYLETDPSLSKRVASSKDIRAAVQAAADSAQIGRQRSDPNPAGFDAARESIAGSGGEPGGGHRAP
jgi:endonuclease YncB( thermonuclease family)